MTCKGFKTSTVDSERLKRYCRRGDEREKILLRGEKRGLLEREMIGNQDRVPLFSPSSV